MRFGRPKVPNFTRDEKFVIGKGIQLSKGRDVSIFATGHLVWEALEASKKLNEHNISCDVINITTIKPLDNDLILKSVKKTKCAVVAEEHQILGGLGCSIAQLTSQKFPIPIDFVAINDSFGESGKPMELMKKYKIDKNSIVSAVKKVIKKKAN